MKWGKRKLELEQEIEILEGREARLRVVVKDLELDIAHRMRMGEAEVAKHVADVWAKNQKAVADAECSFHNRNQERMLRIAALDGEIAAKSSDKETIIYLKSVIEQLIAKPNSCIATKKD